MGSCREKFGDGACGRFGSGADGRARRGAGRGLALFRHGQRLSQIFTAGPAVVAALGETQDKESLGGSAIHTRNGVIDDEAG